MFENKIAIVTGGTGALGRVIVSLFADKGMRVYVPVRKVEDFRNMFDTSKSEEAAAFKLRKIYGLQCDAMKEDDVIRFIGDVLKQEKHIDYLINTVGGYHTKKNIVEMDTELVDKMMNLNFKSSFYFCKNVLKSMIENGFGRIVAIGAMPALEITPGKFAYSVSKSNVVNLIQTIAEECKDNDITANVIVPSIIDTPANRASMPNADFSRWVKPEDIAETVLFLLSDTAGSLRGNVVKMYGRV
jgi:NAD(P)-dependent dehydrogenase (short-subunit alcohol dehydrogenase family)